MGIRRKESMSRRRRGVIGVLVEVPEVIGTLSHLYVAWSVGYGVNDGFLCVCSSCSSEERHGGWRGLGA